MSDKVNHPSHYGGDTVYETIKVQEAKLSHDEFVGAMKFQVAKYLDRSGKKNILDVMEDWRKAQFYLNYLVDYQARYAAGMVGECRAVALLLERTPKSSRRVQQRIRRALARELGIIWRELGLQTTKRVDDRKVVAAAFERLRLTVAGRW